MSLNSSSGRGLSLLKAIEKYVASKPNQWDTRTVLSNIQILSASEGRLHATFPVTPWMCNSLDYLHGGYVASLVDVASLFGFMSHDKGRLAWTNSMNIVYPKAAMKGDILTVETSPLHVVGILGLMEVLVRNESGDLIAKGTTVLQAGSEKLLEKGQEILGFK